MGRGRRPKETRPKILWSDHQPLDQGIKYVPTVKGAEPTIRAVTEIYRDLWGSHHHASRSQMPI
ncbi:unnamed protein product [Prunus brigantina]